MGALKKGNMKQLIKDMANESGLHLTGNLRLVEKPELTGDLAAFEAAEVSFEQLELPLLQSVCPSYFKSLAQHSAPSLRCYSRVLFVPFLVLLRCGRCAHTFLLPCVARAHCGCRYFIITKLECFW